MGRGKLTRAINCLLRPIGGCKGIPKYTRLWATFSSESAETKYRSLPFTGFPSGVGATAPDRATNKTIAVRIYRQGKNFLVFYDLTQSRARGMFYLGDDSTFLTGTYDFSAGPPSYEVLAVGLDANARWFGKRLSTQLMLSNNVNVDPAVCVQLGRTAVPGKWRLAGSNVAPAAAVISQVTPAGTTNVQARWTIPGSGGSAAFTFYAVPGTDFCYSYAASGLTSVNASTDIFTIGGFLPTDGQPVLIVATSIPGGLTNNTVYYCRDVSGTTAKLAATSGGPAINITSAGSGIALYQLFGHGYTDDQAVTLTTTGTLPAPLATATTYYMRDISTNVFFFKLAATAGGSAIDITTTGSGVQSMLPTGVAVRAGTASLTFTADATNFPGTLGNSRIRVFIQNSAYVTGAISSTLSGGGTTSNPYTYTILTGSLAANSSNDAIVSYVNTDTRAIGILRASTSAASATVDTGTYGPTLLSGGAGSGTSEGLTSQTCIVYLRYFDTGNERLGYEGISSDASNEIILDEATRADLLISITTDPSAEGGRFDLIRVYLSFGEGTSQIYNLVGEVANTTGTKTLQVGTNTEIGQPMSVDQNRLLPFRDVVMANNQVWSGGGTDNPDFLYVSKTALDDEAAPEGAFAGAPELLTISQQTSKLRITALYSDDYRVHCHTNNGVVLLNPNDPSTDKHIPQVSVGALNPACIGIWENSQIYYLGSDIMTYEFAGARYGRRNIAAKSKDAIEYILDQANIDKIGQQPDRVNTWVDLRSELMWMSYPSATDNELISFAYDFQQGGIVGQFTYPKFYCVAKMEAERTETMFCDEGGNLFYMDSRDQNDSGDELPASSVWTPHAISDPIPAVWAGYGYVDIAGLRYYGGVQSVIESGMVDLSNMPAFKAFIGVMFATVARSRAIVDVTLTNASGYSVTRSLTDLYSLTTQQIRKVACYLGGSMVKLKFTVTNAEQSAWIIRSASLLYRSGGQL